MIYWRMNDYMMILGVYCRCGAVNATMWSMDGGPWIYITCDQGSHAIVVFYPFGARLTYGAGVALVLCNLRLNQSVFK